MGGPFLCAISSEPAPQGDKNLAMAGVADRDSKGKHADRGIGYQACDTILAENRLCLRRPDLAGLIAEGAVEALSQAGGQSCNSPHITCAGQIGIGTPELVKG